MKLKFKTLQVTTTKNKSLADRTVNRMAKEKLRKAIDELNALKAAPETFLKLSLPPQKPSNNVNYIVAYKPNPRRSFQKRKLITSTPHFNKQNRFSDASSSLILSPIDRRGSQEGAETIHRPASEPNVSSDSEIELPRSKKRTSCEPVQNVIPNKKRDPVDKLDASSDIVFVENKSDESGQRGPSPARAKSKKRKKEKATLKKASKIPDCPTPNNQSPLANPTTPRDRTGFVNAIRGSGKKPVAFQELVDPELEAFAKSIELAPRLSDLANSPSPRKRCDLTSSRVAVEQAQTNRTDFRDAGPSVVRNLLDDLQAEKSPNNDVHTVLQHGINIKSPLKKAKGKRVSKSDNRPTKKGKATKKTSNSEPVGSSPKIDLEEEMKLRKEIQNVDQQNNSRNELQNLVSTNQTNMEKIVPIKSQKATNVNKSARSFHNIIDKLMAKKAINQVPSPPPPPPVETVQEEINSEHDDVSCDTSSLPTSDDEKELPALPISAARKSQWDALYKTLNSYSEAVQRIGETCASYSEESDDEGLFIRREKSVTKSKLADERNTRKDDVKKTCIDRQIQTERLPVPDLRRSAILKSQSSKSRIPDDVSEMSDSSPNIYDSLEPGNVVDAFGFSNSNEPMLSLQDKPFRCDMPSTNVDNLTWSNSNIILPHSSSDSDSENSHTTENNLSCIQYVKKYYKNKTVKSADRSKSKLVHPVSENSPPPRRTTRSQNNTDASAKRKLTFHKCPTDDLALNEARDKSSHVETQPSREQSKLEKSLAQQTHYSIILQAPQFDKEVPQASQKSLETSRNKPLKSPHLEQDIVQNWSTKSSEKSRGSKRPTLEPPRFSRHDVDDVLSPTTAHSSFKRTQQELENHIQKVAKRPKKSGSKSHPLAEPLQSDHSAKPGGLNELPTDADSGHNELPTDADSGRNELPTDVDSGLNGSVDSEVPESSAKNRRSKSISKQQTSQEPFQFLPVDVCNNSSADTNNDVPESSGTSKGKRKHRKSNPKQQSLQTSAADNSSRAGPINIYVDQEVPESARSKGRKLPKKRNLILEPPQSSRIRLRSATHRANDAQTSVATSRIKFNKNNNKKSVVIEEPPQNSTGIRLSANFHENSKENVAPEDKMLSIATTSNTTGRTNTDVNEGLDIEKRAEVMRLSLSATTSSATGGKATKKTNRKAKTTKRSHVKPPSIEPMQDTRRLLRVRKPPKYRSKITFAESIEAFGFDPRLLKSVSTKVANFVTETLANKSQKLEASRVAKKRETASSSRVRTKNTTPVAVENTLPPPQENQQNVSDSVLMPPPATNVLRIRKPTQSSADSGFDMTNSVQKKVTTKAGKRRGGKKATKAAEQVPGPSCTLEPPNDFDQLTAESSSSSSTIQSMSASSNGQLEEVGYLFKKIDGKVVKIQFACGRPGLLDYTSVGNLHINAVTKEPGNLYTMGYLRLDVGVTKESSSSVKFAFVYSVVKGVAEATVENTSVRLFEGGSFCVPVGSIYSIKNTSLDSVLVIHFTRIREQD